MGLAGLGSTYIDSELEAMAQSKFCGYTPSFLKCWIFF
jgi:hypothetical protein